MIFHVPRRLLAQPARKEYKTHKKENSTAVIKDGESWSR